MHNVKRPGAFSTIEAGAGGVLEQGGVAVFTSFASVLTVFLGRGRLVSHASHTRALSSV